MITRDPKEFVSEICEPRFSGNAPALPRGVFLLQPEAFQVSTESASDNVYVNTQQPADPERALAQSRALAAAIERKGLEVEIFPANPETPDDVFPNNAFATIPGKLILGHMWHAGRKAETSRLDIRAYFLKRGYELEDLSQQDCIAELTGTLILDRARRVGFCGMSDRVNDAGLTAMHKAFDLRLTFGFDLVKGEYHTNVVMTILAGRACVLCPGSFADPDVPMAIAQAFPDRCLFLTREEKNAFAGNCIALTDKDLFMSQTGFNALKSSSRERLNSWGFEFSVVELDEFEKAGGSLRCMVAEIF